MPNDNPIKESLTLKEYALKIYKDLKRKFKKNKEPETVFICTDIINSFSKFGVSAQEAVSSMQQFAHAYGKNIEYYDEKER